MDLTARRPVGRPTVMGVGFDQKWKSNRTTVILEAQVPGKRIR
jgi:hypothetical protein